MIPDFDDVDLTTAREICRKSLAEHGPGWLSAKDTRAVLAAVRLPLPPGGVAGTADEAVELGAPHRFSSGSEASLAPDSP